MRKLFMDDERFIALELTEREMNKTLLSMRNPDITIEEREQLIKQLEQLTQIRNTIYSNGKIEKAFDWSIVVSGVFGLVGVAKVLEFEKTGILTTKTLPNVLKWIGK